MPFAQAVEREDVAHTSSTTSTCTRSVVAFVQLLDHALLGFGQYGNVAMQEQRGLVEQALGALRP
jgi:hypothetical protein